jgi:hypothetical protein
MDLKDDLLTFFSGENKNTASENYLPIQDAILTDGLCVVCDNKPHCVWVENNKIYCQHYE